MEEEIIHFRQLQSYQEEQFALETAWFRQCLTIAAGTLAVTVSVGLPSDAPQIARELLAGAWTSLAISLCAGGAATYVDAARAKRRTTSFAVQIESYLEGDAGAIGLLVTPAPPWLLWSRAVTVVSLGLSVALLAAYGVAALLMG